MDFMLNKMSIPLENMNIKVSMGPVVFDILLDIAFTAEGLPLGQQITHKHPVFEVHFITKGSGSCVVDGCDIPLQVGDVILVAPGVFHSFKGTAPAAKGYLQFTFSVKESYEDLFPRTEAWEILESLSLQRNVKVIQLPNIFNLVDLIRHELDQNLFGCYGKVQGLFMQLLIDILREASTSQGSREQQRIPLKTKDESRTRIIDMFFERLISEQLRIEQLADELHLSIKQTQRVVRQLYGKPFKQLATETFIEVAKELLTTSKLTVQQIAERLGYAETRHFSRRFAQATGTTPNEYRSRFSKHTATLHH